MNIRVSQCASQVITVGLPFVDQLYGLTYPFASYTAPAYVSNIDINTCPVSYSNLILPANTWITGVNDNNGVGATVGWQTSDEAHIGYYTVTISGAGPCTQIPTENSYQLEVASLCKIVPIVIDALDAKFAYPSVI